MATAVRMPQLGESVVEGTILHWLKQPGDAVAKNEPLVTISTDKIDTEVPAPVDGVLLEVAAIEGATVSAGTVIATIGAPGEVSMLRPSEAAPPPSTQPEPVSSAVETTTSANASAERPSGRVFISPIVARMSAEHGIDLAQVSGTGLGGRITKKDLEAYIAAIKHDVAEGEESAAEAAPEPMALDVEDVLEPLTTMRRAIAQHMVLSKRTSPHVTTICEVDMTNVVRHREANKRTFTRNGATLTYTAYFVAAAVAGLNTVPE
ncbi:MAG: biotin/lipoyl-containing protein, partial [Caldilinea sp.]